VKKIDQTLIGNDPLVSAVFAAVSEYEGDPLEKLKAVVRAGKIAEAFMCGSTTAFKAVELTFGEFVNPVSPLEPEFAGYSHGETRLQPSE